MPPAAMIARCAIGHSGLFSEQSTTDPLSIPRAERPFEIANTLAATSAQLCENVITVFFCPKKWLVREFFSLSKNIEIRLGHLSISFHPLSIEAVRRLAYILFLTYQAT